jgi:hypothetical protein
VRLLGAISAEKESANEIFDVAASDFTLLQDAETSAMNCGKCDIQIDAGF